MDLISNRSSTSKQREPLRSKPLRHQRIRIKSLHYVRHSGMIIICDVCKGKYEVKYTKLSAESHTCSKRCESKLRSRKPSDHRKEKDMFILRPSYHDLSDERKLLVLRHISNWVTSQKKENKIMIVMPKKPTKKTPPQMDLRQRRLFTLWWRRNTLLRWLHNV